MNNNNNKTNNFMQGVIALLFSQLIIKILGMFYSLYLTNKPGFGDKGNAIFYSTYQIYIIFLTISSIGIPNSISKIIAEELAIGNIKGSKRILKIAFCVFGGLGFLCSVVLYFSADFVSDKILRLEESKYILKLLAPSIFWITLSSIFRGYFNAKRRIKISARAQIIEQFFKTIITIIFVEIVSNLTNNTELMVNSSTIALVLASIISFIYTFKSFKKFEKIDENEYLYSNFNVQMSVKEIFIKIMSISIPITLSTVLVTISKNIDSFTIIRLLRRVFSEEIVKERYGILSSKVELLTIFPTALNGSIALAIIPEISRINKIRNDKFLNKYVSFSLLLTLLVSIPMMLLMYIYSNEIINFLYPNANKGAELLKISSFSIVFLCLIQTLTGILQGLGKTKIYIRVTSFALLIKFVLNVLLISIKGIYEKGAIISTIISDGIICFLLIRQMNKELNIKFNIKHKIIKICFCIILPIMLITSLELHFIIKMFLILIIYVLLILSIKIFTEDELKMLPNGEKIYGFMKKTKIY